MFKVIVLLFVALGTLNYNAYAQDAKVITIRVPMESFETVPSYGGVVINVILGDNTKARFLVDTGADGTFIGEELIEMMSKNEFEQINLVNSESALKRNIKFVASVKSVIINNKKIRDFPMNVMKKGFFSDEKIFLSKAKVDGVLGMNYLSHFCLYLDYPKKQFFLNAGGNLSAESLRQIGFADSAASPLPLEQSPKNEFQYVVPLSINNNTVPLQIDTGSQYTIINDKAIPTGGTVTEAKKDVLTAYGRKTLREISHKEVVLGSFRRERFSVGSTPESADKAEGYYGLLGLDILSSLRMVLDFPAKKMYLMEIQP
jgi:predicted aspartyl protease